MHQMRRRSHYEPISKIQPTSIPGLESKHRRSTSQTAAVIRYPAIKKLLYLSWYLVQWERVDDAELGMEKLAAQASIATLDEIKPHQVALKSRVILESPSAVRSRQYLYGTTRPDTAHIGHEMEVRDAHGEMQRVGALINCSSTSIFMAPRLPR